MKMSQVSLNMNNLHFKMDSRSLSDSYEPDNGTTNGHYSKMEPLSHVNAVTGRSPDDIRSLQRNCPDLKPMFKYLEEGEVPKDKRKAAKLVAEAQNFIISDDVLYHLYQHRSKGLPKATRVIKQLAVPKVLRDDTLRSYHDSLLGGAPRFRTFLQCHKNEVFLASNVFRY